MYTRNDKGFIYNYNLFIKGECITLPNILKEKNRYLIIFRLNGKYKKISYSESSYGIYAKKLIELSSKSLKRYNNYYTFTDDTCVIHIYSKKYGYHDAIISIEDFDLVKAYRWVLKKDRNTFYLQAASKTSKNNIVLHRLIMKPTGDYIVDHINRNGLDNRRENLRIVSLSLNSRNKKLYSEFSGLNIRDNFVEINWMSNGKRITKCYSFKKYGKDTAIEKAKYKLIKEKINNGYILDTKYLKYAKRKIKIYKSKI